MKQMNCILLILLSIMAGCSSSGTAVRPSYHRSGTSDKVPHRNTSKESTKKKSVAKKDSEKSQEKSSKDKKKSIKTVSNIEKKASRYIGVRYKYGGTTSKGFDCSGYVWRVYQDIGMDFSRASSKEYFKRGQKISQKNAKKGDLVFFRSKGRINHVGIFLGGNRFIHSSSSRGVIESSLENSYWKPRIAGFRRFI